MSIKYLHLLKNHGANLLGRKQLVLALDLHHHVGLAVLVLKTEGEVLGVVLDRRVIPAAANKALDVEDSVLGVQGKLVLGSISDKTLALLRERHVRGSDAVALVVGDNLNTAVLVDTNAAEVRKKLK